MWHDPSLAKISSFLEGWKPRKPRWTYRSVFRFGVFRGVFLLKKTKKNISISGRQQHHNYYRQIWKVLNNKQNALSTLQRACSVSLRAPLYLRAIGSCSIGIVLARVLHHLCYPWLHLDQDAKTQQINNLRQHMTIHVNWERIMFSFLRLWQNVHNCKTIILTVSPKQVLKCLNS